MKKTITIGIDGGDFYPFGVVNSGIKRIVDSFLRNIPTLKDYDIVINYYYFNKNLVKSPLPKTLPYTLHIKRLHTKFFSSLFLPLNLLNDNNDIYIGFSTVTPHFLGYFPIKKIIFLYDLGFLSYPALYKSAERMIDHTIQTIILSDALIVLSNAARRSIVNGIKDVELKKIVVKYPGNDHIKIKPQSMPPIKEQYFLYVGVIKPIKDVMKLIQIFYEFKNKNPKQTIKLILVGKYEDLYWKSIIKSMEYNEVKKDIILKQNVSDKELVNYYHHAIALLNVSKVEGLGFPVLEALSLKKTVIVNNLSIYKEFKNKYNNLLIKKDDAAIIKSMEKVLKKPINYEEKLELFTWKEFAEKILEVAVKLHKT